ncbi:MAG TPA: hypothetical protein VK034_29165 [Enhygromyxa sp.]|nr:hypothetical protein [Enhygromyxa sp.]
MSRRLPPDFADLFACLNEAGADYMLVGGYAVNAYGYIRATEDLDVWVRPSPENAARVMVAMANFGMPPGLRVEDLAQIDGPPPTGFRFGRRPLTVDLLTSVQGISFDQAWGESIVSNFDGLRVRIIGIEALLANKRATKRLKDAADVEELERLRALGLLE